MKRIAFLLPLVAGLAMPISATSISVAHLACEVSDLPWSTVSLVLEAVTDVRPYSYGQLVDWYRVGRVTVELKGSGYEVRILNDDGLLDVVLIDEM